MVKRSSKAIDIRARSWGLTAILLRCGIARCTERHISSRLPPSKVMGNAKIDQIEIVRRSEHYIGGLEITKDDRWLACMQIVKHRTQLDTDLEYLLKQEVPISGIVQALF